MAQKRLIVFLGIIGILVLVNSYFAVIVLHSDAFSFGMPLHCHMAFCGGYTTYRGVDPNGLVPLYDMIYIPVMIIFTFLLLPLFFEEVSHSFRKTILIISGINTLLILRVLISGITFLFSVDLLNGGLGVLFLNLFLFSLRLIPFLFNLITFVSFYKKEPLEDGLYYGVRYLYPKYYPD